MNKPGPYEQVIEGEWFMWNRRGNKLQCCDCGLVHVIDFRVNKLSSAIECRFSTDRKATARIRKRVGLIIKRNERK